MKMTVRMIAAVMAVVMAFSAIPVTAFASQNEYLEVVVDRAPLRDDCYEKGNIITRCTEGAVLVSTGSTMNRYFHKWYKVSYEGSTYYIYSENVKVHKHNYQTLNLEGLSLKVCRNCGDIVTNDPQSDTSNEYIGLAAMALPAIDGPIPAGDVLAAILLAYAAWKMSAAMVPVTAEIVEQIRKIDFSDYLKKRNENVCTPYTFRRVQRYPGGLKYLDDACMDCAEAYIWVAVFKGDVYTASEDAALILAAMSPKGSVCERDKDQVSYFYHYHLSTDRSEKGHVFFGANDLGQVPA